jgi:hypothetical protein
VFDFLLFMNHQVIRSFGLLMLFFVFLAFPVVGQDLELVLEDIAPQVEVGGSARYLLHITNTGDVRDVYRINGDPYDVSPFSDYVQFVVVNPNQAKVDAGETVTVEVSIKILGNAKSDETFQADVVVTSLINANTKEIVAAKGYVVPKKEVVQVSVDAPHEIYPGENFEVVATFKNRLNLDLKNFEVSVYSDLPGISESTFTDFKPREEREMEFVFPLMLSSKPGDYALNVRVYDGSQLKGNFVSAFKVFEKTVVDEQASKKGGFMKNIMTVMKMNEGNSIADERIVVDSNIIKNIFVSTQPEAERDWGDLIWEFTFEPGETFEAVVVWNYRPLFYGFLVVVLAIILLYFYIERSVVVKKRLFTITSGPGGISEFKVLLLVRNGRRSSLDGVKVMDVLPNIIEPTYEFGTLKPDLIQRGSRSKRFVWEIGSLEPGEERVLSYRVKSKMHLSEGARLPPASLHYLRGHKQVSMVSHKLDIISK